jgi:hypothetical protein
MSTSLRLAKPEHEIAYQEVCALLAKHAGALDAFEMLAVAANMLGKLVALQDQRKITPKMALELVARNIECGNKQVLDQLAQGAAGQA